MKGILVSLTLVAMVSMVALPAFAAAPPTKAKAKPVTHAKASASGSTIKSVATHVKTLSTVQGTVTALQLPKQESPARFTLVAGKVKYVVTVPSALFAGKSGLKLANGEKVSVTGLKHQGKTGVMIMAHAVTVIFSLPKSGMVHRETHK